jgi:lactoylglutathione lyase
MKLSHIALTVSSLRKSSQFYEQVFGWIPGQQIDTDQLSILNIDAGEISIELLQYNDEDPGLNRSHGYFDHLAVEVKDLDHEIKQLKQKGVSFLTPSPITGPLKQRFIFLSGPDGERIELLETLD